MTAILIALGGNLPSPELGGPKEILEAAIGRLAAGGVRVLQRSRWYGSPAWPPSDQPDYVNGVIAVDWRGTPEALLALLQEVENAFGRVRTVRNAARTLDLDLLAFHDLIIRTEGDRLILPHPRLQDRAFVLLPLQEVAPGWIHPVTGLSVERMLQDVDCRETHVLAGDQG